MAKGTWVEYANDQGRPYWYHTKEKRSVWEKPAELKTPRERALDKTPWRQYRTGEKVYYVNRETKESVWRLPDDLREYLESIPEAAVASQKKNPLPVPEAPEAPVGSIGARSAPYSINSYTPTFNTPEQAENAFIRMLEQKGVQSDWTWEQTIREIITETNYKALKTIADRRAVFQKYINRLRALEERDRRDRISALRPRIARALEARGGFAPFASYATFEHKLRRTDVGHRVFRDDALARELYELFVRDAQRRRDNAARRDREHAVEALAALLRTFELGPATRWRDVHRLITESAAFRDDARLQHLPLVDMLAIFEKHIDALEADARAAHERATREQRTAQRRRREAFVELLREREADGTLSPRSTWASFLPHIRHEPRFVELAGMPGSSAQELFYDRLDELERAFSERMRLLVPQLHRHHVAVQDEAQWEAVAAAARAPDAPEQLRVLGDGSLRELFGELVYQAGRDAHEGRRRAERRVRHYADELRFAFKRVDPPLDTDAPFDDVLPRIRTLPEFVELERVSGSSEAAQGAWDKFRRRQAEKRDERASEYIDRDSDERKRKAAPLERDPREARQRMRYDDDAPAAA